jgi:RNA polymerase sigma factor (sigma-70 family)
MPTPDSNVVPLYSDSNTLEKVDGEALDRLMNEHAASLRNSLHRYPSPREDIEDAIQETFCKVLQGGQIKKMDNPGAFLYKIARNILIDRYRKRRLEKNVNDNYHLNSNDESREEMFLEYGEMTIAYQKALSDLPGKCRQVFLMRRYDGLANSEIAEKLGISIRMVQKHMIKALSHFNKCLR